MGTALSWSLESFLQKEENHTLPFPKTKSGFLFLIICLEWQSLWNPVFLHIPHSLVWQQQGKSLYFNLEDSEERHRDENWDSDREWENKRPRWIWFAWEASRQSRSTAGVLFPLSSSGGIQSPGAEQHSMHSKDADVLSGDRRGGCDWEQNWFSFCGIKIQMQARVTENGTNTFFFLLSSNHI